LLIFVLPGSYGELLLPTTADCSCCYDHARDYTMLATAESRSPQFFYTVAQRLLSSLPFISEVRLQASQELWDAHYLQYSDLLAKNTTFLLPLI